MSSLARNWKPRGWSQIELAEVLGRPARLVSELIAGKRSITPETAKGLGAAFGTGPELWMNLERDYRLARAVHDDASVQRRARLYAKAPVKEMAKRGWIEPSDNIDVLEKRVVDFLRIPNLDVQPGRSQAAKKGRARAEPPTPAQWAWLFRVKQLASSISAPPYSRQALIDAIASMEPLLAAPAQVRHVPGILARCGVRFLIVEQLPHANIDGACFWLDTRSPVVALTMRHDKADRFWLVLRHELEHVLGGHGQVEAVIDNLDGAMAPSHLAKHLSRVRSFILPAATFDGWGRIPPLP